MAGPRAPVRTQPAEKLAVMSLGEHLEELRSRIIKCLAAVAVAFAVCWLFRDYLRVVVLRPHEVAMRAFELPPALKFSGYFETIVVQIKVCAIFGLLIVSPYVLYHIWAFIAPGLFVHERRRGLKLGLACVACLLAGVCFGYFLFIPTALRYLIMLAGGWAEPMLMIGSYLSLFFFMTFALAIAFQTPIIVFFLIRWGVLDAKAMGRYRKPVILGAFVVGAVLTPPDPVTQIMMATTLIMLYDLGGLVAAPSRSTLMSFLKFTGTVVLIGGAVWAWFRFWPIGHVEALSGRVDLGGVQLLAQEPVGLRRGTVCETGLQGVARLELGGDDAARLFAAPGTHLQVHNRGSVSLYGGRLLADSSGPALELGVRTGAATATLKDARADFTVPNEDAVTVRVFRGEVRVKAGEEIRRVKAGQEVTFRRGGSPVELSDAEKEWQHLIEGGGAEPGATPASP
jgi:sec-independent protein translocase protein TatC